MYSHPKSPSGVLTDSMTILARSWRRLTTLGLLVMVPLGTATLLFLEAVAPDGPLVLPIEPQGPTRDGGEVFGRLALTAAIALLAHLGGSLFVLSGTHLIVVSDSTGKPKSLAEVMSSTGRRYPAALAATLIASAPVAGCIFAGLMVDNPLVSIPLYGAAVWLGVSASMTIASLVIEKLTPVAAVKRSYRLVRGRRGQTFAFLGVTGALAAVAILLIQLVATPLVALGYRDPVLIVTAVLGVLFQGVLIGSLGAPITAWYLDLTARAPRPSSADS